MKTIRSEGKEDLGGRRNPLSEGVPSPSKPPLTSPNFPQEHPPVQSEDLIRFVQGGCSRGKFLLVWEVGSCYSVRLSHLIGGYGIVQPLQVTFARSGTTHGSFPTSLIFRKILFPRGFPLYRGAIRRERPAFPRPPLTTNLLPFLSGSGREATAAKIPLDGILLGSSRNSQHGKRLHQNQYNKKQGAKIPLLKVLEILKNFFQEVFKQGSGQSPEVLGFGTESQGLPITPHSIPWPREQPP